MSNDIRCPERIRIYPPCMGKKATPGAIPSEPVIDPIRRGVGMRLASARAGKKLTQDDVAIRFSVNKATVSAWETGRGDPGIYRLRELSKLYDIPTDAVLWEDSLTPEAMKVAVQFDSLNEKQKRTFYAMWMAYVQETVSDAQVEESIPATQHPQQFEYKKQVLAPALVHTEDYSGPDRRKAKQ